MMKRGGAIGSSIGSLAAAALVITLSLTLTVHLPIISSADDATDSAQGGTNPPHALFGFVYDIYGAKLGTVVEVTVRNNRTGATISTLTDPSSNDYSYRFNDIGSFAIAGDRLTIGTVLGDLDAANWTTVNSYAYQDCDLWLWGEEASAEIPVHLGWNFVSTPLLARHRSVDSVFADAECEWTSVMRYEVGLGGGRWVTYDASNPAFMNSLDDVFPGEGVWLFVTDTGDGSISVSGLLLANMEIGLVKGWNMAGYPSLDPQTVASSLVGVSFDSVQNYSSTDEYNLREMLGTNPLTSGGGYWIHAVSSCVWNVFNPGGVSFSEPDALTSSPPVIAAASSGTEGANATVFAGQAFEGLAFPAQRDVPLLNLTIWNLGLTNDSLYSVTVDWTGTTPSDAESVSLWVDVDGDLAVTPVDIELGSGALSSGAITFPAWRTVPAGGSLDLLVACDVATDAVPGDHLDASIPLAGLKLANEGNTTSTLDPTGEAFLTAPLYAPHVVYGFVYDASPSPCTNATVTVTNQRTGQTLANDTDSSGKYVVDIGAMPGGYVLNDTLVVKASDGALLNGQNQTNATDGFGDRCNVWMVIGGKVEAAPFIRLHKQSGQLNITWAPVANATSYRVYRSPAIDGTGFVWNVSLAETGSSYFVDVGALADANDYSYVVRGVSAQGEGPKSNIGWKKVAHLQYNPTTTSNNWIALPYVTDLIDAAALKADIGPSCTKVSMLNPTTQFLRSFVGIMANNFALQAGVGYQVVVTASTDYTIVGSHNPMVQLSLQFNAATTSNNWVSLPYHGSLAHAAGVKASVGPTCTKVSMLVLNTQFLKSFVGIMANNFPLAGGIAYQLVVNANTVWTPPTRGY